MNLIYSFLDSLTQMIQNLGTHLGHRSFGFFIFTFILSLFLTPLAIAIAKRFKVTDQSNHRKLHQGEVPRLGGLSILISYATMHFLLIWGNQLESQLSWPILGIAFLIFILGVLDDRFTLSAKPKLLGQIILSSFAWYLGLQMNEIHLTDTYSLSLNSSASYMITLFWMVSVMNAYNLIDGIDGLAGGVAMICLAALSLLGIISFNGALVCMAMTLGGSILGFLCFNLSPAKIFMGDSGSLTIGFLLSIFTLQMNIESPVHIPIYVALLILALPIVDTLIAILRRAIKYLDHSRNNYHWLYRFKKVLIGIVVADGDHIHHRLFRRLKSHLKVSFIAYLLTFIPALLALTSLYLPSSLGWLLFSLYAYFMFQFIISLEYNEFRPRAQRYEERETELSRHFHNLS